MKIIVNGEQKICKEAISVLELLKDIDIERDRVAVELNSNIIPKSKLGQITLKEDDKLEIVTFVGGG